MQIKITVDTGFYFLCVNKTMQEQLGLSFIKKRKEQLADGSALDCDVVGPIEINFKNRRCNVDAMVLKGENETLSEAIPIEDMDVLRECKINCVS